MKRFLIPAVMAMIAASPVLAAGKKSSSEKQFAIGAGYGLGNGGVLSVRGDYDISDRVNAPVKARVGWDHYSLDYTLGTSYTWSYNVYYGGAYYDLNEILKLDKKIHPFAGLGFGFGSASCSGSSVCSFVSTPTVGGFYYIGGLQYNMTPEIDAEVSLSGWTGVSLGANYKF